MAPCVDRMREVRLYGRRIGEIRRLGLNRLEFEYESDYAREPGAPPLSVCLDVNTTGASTEAATCWFSGLLPEGLRREHLARIVGTTTIDLWSLLDAAGAECAGAVQIVNPAYEDAPAYFPLDDSALASLLHTIPVDPIGTVDQSARISLAGAQDKVALAREDDGSWSVPLAGAASTHILKPQSARFAGLVENEHWCMTLARTAGLDAARTEILTVQGASVLVVERYDRTRTPGGALARIHQEDTAQALATLKKYESCGGPPAREIARVKGIDGADLLDRLMFNWMVGNCDGHAKNFSVLEPETPRARLAPAYDVLCAETCPGLDYDLALKLGAAQYPAQVTLDDLVQTGAEMGVGAEQTREHVQSLGARLAEAAESPRLAPYGLRITVQDLVRSRAERASRLFAPKTPAGRPRGSSQQAGRQRSRNTERDT